MKLTADEIFQGNTYPLLVKTLQSYDKNSSYSDSTLPTDFARKLEPATIPGVNFTNILQAAFAPIFFSQKITEPNCKKKNALLTLWNKKAAS